MGPEQLGFVAGFVLVMILVVFRSRAAMVFVGVAVLAIAGVGIVASMESGPTHAELEAAFARGCGKGCAQSGTPAHVCTAQCDCMVDRLQERRSPDEFSAFIRAANASLTPEIRSEMERVALSCLASR